MDNPIINPIWFYLADAIPSFGVFLGVLSGGLCIVGLTFLMTSETTKEDINRCKKCLIPGLIVLLLSFMIPSKDAIYQMAAANAITPNNIKIVSDYVGDTATNVSDNLTDTIKDIMDYSVDRIYNIRNNEKAGD